MFQEQKGGSVVITKLNQVIQSINNSLSTARNKWGRNYSYDTLPPEKVLAASAVSPIVTQTLVRFSCEEYDRNPHYQLVIENLTNHTLGPHPKIIAIGDKVEDRDNDYVEDQYLYWLSNNGIGKLYREIRRLAAKTGIGIGIPFWDSNITDNVPTRYKVFGRDVLQSPYDASLEDRVINGVQYNANWEPEKFFILDTDHEFGQRITINEVKEYDVSQVIYFCRTMFRSIMWPIPECYAAFTFYPYLRRYIQAVIERAEFNASFPMALELDPKVYRVDAAKVPTGKFEYEPRMVPSLPPGTKLNGIPNHYSGADTNETMEMFAATCALTVQMPRNLATANSKDSNMSSSQVDIQPWSTKIHIDRFDMEPMFRKSFKDWWAVAKLMNMPKRVTNAYPNMFPHYYVYQDMFEHPDPNKRASARATDLQSGATTLNLLFSKMGLNFRREVQREAKALGMDVEDLIRVYISSRSANALNALEQNQELANDR